MDFKVYSYFTILAFVSRLTKSRSIRLKKFEIRYTLLAPNSYRNKYIFKKRKNFLISANKNTHARVINISTSDMERFGLHICPSYHIVKYRSPYMTKLSFIDGESNKYKRIIALCHSYRHKKRGNYFVYMVIQIEKNINHVARMLYKNKVLREKSHCPFNMLWQTRPSTGYVVVVVWQTRPK